jgi:hypothetical protein
MNPKANKLPEPGEYKGPTDVEEKPPERKRGMWRATYEAVQISTAEGHTTRITDRGSFDFTVDRNGEIKGDGSGHYDYHDAYPDAVALGGVGYSFKVEGTTDPEVNFSPARSAPALVKITITYSDGHTVLRPTVNLGPLLFYDGIRLQEGTYYYKGPTGDTRSITLQKPVP